MSQSYDVLVVGGGVIGLMTARDLADEGLSVAIFDRQTTGREASWAGAGIIPPAQEAYAVTAYDRLRAVSYSRFAALAEELKQTTHVDTGYRKTGALEVLRSDESVSQRAWIRQMRTDLGVHWDELRSDRLAQREPGLQADRADWIPDVCQIRNPRLLAALAIRCRQLSVDMREHEEIVELLVEARAMGGVRTTQGKVVRAEHVVVTAGAWSEKLLSTLPGPPLPVHPVQGQIVVFQTSGDVVRYILFDGKRYIVPREDGLVLVGATEEDVGFQKRITSEGVGDLIEFAHARFPALKSCQVVHSWAGLRPASSVGHPLIGPWNDIRNLWVATGHFRHGLQQSPGTARLLADWLVGRPSFADPKDFSLSAQAADFSTAFHS